MWDTSHDFIFHPFYFRYLVCIILIQLWAGYHSVINHDKRAWCTSGISPIQLGCQLAPRVRYNTYGFMVRLQKINPHHGHERLFIKRAGFLEIVVTCDL